MRSLALRWLALAVLVVACARPASPTRAPAPSPASAPTHAPLRVGTSGEYPPLSIWKDDRVTGFAPAVVTAFAASESTPISWARFTWPSLSADLRTGRVDLAADGITVRPERSILGRFTVPIARGGAILLLRRPSWALPSAEAAPPLSGIDRPALRVVVNQGGHLERVARGLLHAADIRAIPDNDAVRAAFARGEADAAMTNTFEAPRWAAGLEGVERLGPLTDDVTAIWIRADRTDLEERLDSWLLAEEESGRLAALRAQWIGAGAGPRAALPVSAILAATSERLALMPFVAAAKARANKAVEDLAQEKTVIAASAEAVAKSAATSGRSAPPRQVVEAFFRAQIEAAKAVQRRTTLPPGASSFDLDADLRPAIARISARMASLVVRVPRGTDPAAVLAEARVELASTGLAPDEVTRLAATIAALADHP